MTLPEQPLSQTKRRWYQFRLRTMLILITLVSVGLGIYKPIRLHLEAVDLLNVKIGDYANRPHPDELFYNCFGHNNMAVIQVGLVKIGLRERTPRGGSMGLIPITGDSAEQSEINSGDGYQYFSYSYADGQAECVAYEFSFICNERTVQINDQLFDIATPTVVLVDFNDKILYVYSR